MIKLLIIADDFTGTLDTAVQFAKQGIKTQFTTNIHFDVADSDCEVLAIDAESRHLPGGQAAVLIREIAKKAMEMGIAAVYKKTDSALRGNIGSELSALLETWNQDVLYFAPAYPKEGRTTKNGIHYVNGVPVAQSVFGKDPFEPVVESDIAKIIALQSDCKTVNLRPDADKEIKESEKTICIFDAESDAELKEIAQSLRNHGVTLMAGCAGFAQFLPEILNMKTTGQKELVRTDGMLVMSGSLNPITQEQIRTAGQKDFCRFTLTDEQKMNSNYCNTTDFKEFLKKVAEAYARKRRVIIESVDSANPKSVECSHAALEGEDNEQIRSEISRNLGRIIQGVVESGIRGLFVLIGGDTLASAAKCLGISSITPLCEVSTGAVLTKASYQGDELYIITKSGGLGSRDVLLQIEEKLLI